MEKLLRNPDEIRRLLTDAYIEGVEVVTNGRVAEIVLYLKRDQQRYRIAVYAIDGALSIVLEE
ncbi:MAG TPA: hypothetical protein EYP48_02540 [Ignisphaera sp.]|uniref:PepSY domain-containing protein n=1 Tax=Ignisphaera aggregans TaxID=334771 RepID=A0A832YZG8_9CREN|nr:hypothetical protein [Ignisphaera sp.]HIP56987.1 hypothetical protein [Ignisphaera aggregans]